MNNQKESRVRCSDKVFLEAIFSSSTYAEVAEKTGQKITTTMARYSRAKASLSPKGIELPKMQRKKPSRTVNKDEEMAVIVARLREQHTDRS